MKWSTFKTLLYIKYDNNTSLKMRKIAHGYTPQHFPSKSKFISCNPFQVNKPVMSEGEGEGEM